MKIVIFESMGDQATLAMLQIQEQLPDTDFDIVQTESHFRQLLKVSSFMNSELFILDLNGWWAKPAVNMPDMPEDVLMGGAFNTGFRLHKLIRERRPEVPIIFWSTLVGHSNVDLSPYAHDPNTRAVPKGRGELIPAVKSLLGVKQ